MHPKSKTRYYDEETVKTCLESQKYLQDFLRRYTSFVFERLSSFTSCFEELKNIDVDSPKEYICAQVIQFFATLAIVLS